MSPKIWTLIAGASLGLLMSAACTVTSVDDDGTTGVGGGTTTTTTTTTSNGGSGGDGGAGVGGGGTCQGCSDTLYAVSQDPICGMDANEECEPGSPCEKLVDLIVCACVDDGSGVAGCETECSEGNEDLCQFYAPPSQGCLDCIAGNNECNNALSACELD